MTKDRDDEDLCLERLAEGGITGIILFPQGGRPAAIRCCD